MLPHRNFHFKSYLWGRKQRKFQAGIFQTTWLTNSDLDSYPTPKGRWTHQSQTMKLCSDWSTSYQSNNNEVRLGVETGPKVKMAASFRVFSRELTGASFNIFGRTFHQRLINFCLKAKALHSCSSGHQSWLVRCSWVRGMALYKSWPNFLDLDHSCITSSLYVSLTYIILFCRCYPF